MRSLTISRVVTGLNVTGHAHAQIMCAIYYSCGTESLGENGGGVIVALVVTVSRLGFLEVSLVIVSRLGLVAISLVTVSRLGFVVWLEMSTVQHLQDFSLRNVAPNPP